MMRANPPAPPDDWHELLTRDWREPGDLDTALERIAETAKEGFDADLCVVFAINPVTGRFLPKPGLAGEVWRDRGTGSSLREPRREGLTRQVLHKGLLAVGDITSLDRDDSGFCRQQGIRCFAAVALHTAPQGKPFAVLYVDYRRPEVLGGDLDERLRRFARVASRELQATWLLRRYRWVAETGQRINRRALSEEHLFEELWSRVRRIIDASRCFLLGVYRPEGHLLHLYARIDGAERLEPGRPVDGPVQWLLKEKGLHIKALADETAGAARRVARLPGGLPWEPQSLIFVPLRLEGRPLGVLSVQHPEPGTFDEEDRHLLELLANQVSLALSNAQAYEEKARALREERRLREDEEALIELGKELTLRLDVDELLDLILQRAIGNTRATAGVLVLVDPKRGGDLAVKAEIGVDGVEPGRLLSREEGILGRVARTGELVNADLTDPEWQKIHIPAVAGMRSELAVPLKRGDAIIGVLNVESPKEKFFSRRNERVLNGLGDLAVIALQNAERFQAAEKRQEKLKALDEVGRRVVEQLDSPDQVMLAVVEHVLKLTGATISDLDRYEEGAWITHYRALLTENGKVEVKEPLDLRLPEAKRPARGIMLHVAATRQPVLVKGDAQEDERYRGEPGIHSELAVPLLSGDGELLGVLDVTSTELDAFDEEDQELLELFAQQVVIAIENSHRYAATKRSRRRFLVLHRTGQELARVTDLEQLNEAYGVVVREAQAQFESEVVVRRLDPAGRGFRLAKSTGTSDPAPFELISLDDPLAGKIAAERRTIYVPNALAPPPEVEDFPRSNSRDRAFLVAPISFEDHYFGNLALSHEEVDHFRQADIELAEGLAQQLAITIHRLEQAKAHQETELMGEIGRQAYEIMHSLGNYLGLVPKMVREVRRSLSLPKPNPSNVEARLDRILGQVRKALDLSRDLSHEVTRGAPGDLTIEPVRRLVEEAVDSLDLNEGSKALIRIEMQLSEKTGSVRIDYKQMIHALRNLLTNARDAMPEGGTLAVGADGSGGEIRMWVRDTGCGIPEELLPELFNLGFTTKTKEDHSGFGLWSVRRTVACHGGRIEVESRPGEGSTFTITLPPAQEEPDA